MRTALLSSLQRVSSSAVAWSFLATGLRAGGAVLILPIVLRYLPPDQLGLWYVFQSVASVVLIMDAGFGVTLIRSMGYLWRGVTDLLPHGIAAEESGGTGEPNFKLMADLTVTMKWYYRLIALLVLVGLVGPGSYWMWHRTATLAGHESLRGAWLLFSAGNALNVASAFWICMIIGSNGVRVSEQVFSVSLLLNYAIVAVGLWLGWGLWATVIGQFVQGLAYRLGGKYGFFMLAGPRYSEQRGRASLALIKTLWPMSWRSAVMGLGSCLILYSNTIVCSTLLGLAETASYGLTFQLVTAVSGVSAIWVNVKLPLMNQLRVSGEIAALGRLFIERLRLSLVTYLVGAAGVILVGPGFVRLIGSKTSMLPTAQTATLLLIMFLATHQSLHMSLVLSQNRNPFVIPMLLSGLGIAAASVLLVPFFGIWGLLLAFGFVLLCYLNWWSVFQGLQSLNISPSGFFRSLVLGAPGA